MSLYLSHWYPKITSIRQYALLAHESSSSQLLSHIGALKVLVVSTPRASRPTLKDR